LHWHILHLNPEEIIKWHSMRVMKMMTVG
jgi:hypothetical protein